MASGTESTKRSLGSKHLDSSSSFSNSSSPVDRTLAFDRQ
jgi:hypothetical protein